MLGLDDLKTEAKEAEPGEDIEVGKKDDTGSIEPIPGTDKQELDMLAVGRAMGMEELKDVKKNSLRIQQLMEWAHGKGAKDQVGYVAEIKGLMHRLGSRSIHDLYVYTRLDMDRSETESKMRKMEKPLL